MADISTKLDAIVELVEEGAYFTINRPRQYGKTTVAYSLYQRLAGDPSYLLIEMSFEGIGDAVFEDEKKFCMNFIGMLAEEMDHLKEPALSTFLKKQQKTAETLSELSKVITALVEKVQKKIVLSIDEIDKSSNNQLFLSFLGMLREKYLQRNKQRDLSFQSVILIGVHDIKSLKWKISPDSEGKLNSPWNIAVDFKVDMSFSPREIEAMLRDYEQDRGVQMDTRAVAEKVYYYTSGYPYLVSKICKVADEELMPDRGDFDWDESLIDEAFRYLVDEGYTTTLFDDLAKNLENNPDLYQLVFDIVLNGKRVNYNVLDPVVNLGVIYGIFDRAEGVCKIHNRIFEQKIYGYILSKESRKSDMISGFSISRFFDNGNLNLENVLLAFQQFMKENYAQRDAKFLEREGRLLFLSFLRPIINGKGFDFKEPHVAEERRMDVVVTYNQQRQVVELKRWEGEAYHQQGLQQLSGYLDTYGLKEGFLLIFDFRKGKEYKSGVIQFADKHIFAVWV